jgi:hypothetical protein
MMAFHVPQPRILSGGGFRDLGGFHLRRHPLLWLSDHLAQLEVNKAGPLCNMPRPVKRSQV